MCWFAVGRPAGKPVLAIFPFLWFLSPKAQGVGPCRCGDWRPAPHFRLQNCGVSGGKWGQLSTVKCEKCSSRPSDFLSRRKHASRPIQKPIRASSRFHSRIVEASKRDHLSRYNKLSHKTRVSRVELFVAKMVLKLQSVSLVDEVFVARKLRAVKSTRETKKARENEGRKNVKEIRFEASG